MVVVGDRRRRRTPARRTWAAGRRWRAGGPYGILQAAGLLFFAFAGYARIATLGEEVRDPQRTIPRAIPIALAHHRGRLPRGRRSRRCWPLGPDRLAAATAPLADAVQAAGAGGLAPVVRVGAALAALGALLALIAGVGRTTLAMARHGDLPGWLAAVHPRYRVPHRAEIALGRSWSASWCSPSTCAARSASRPSACCSTTPSPTPPRSPSRADAAPLAPLAATCSARPAASMLVATLPWQAVLAGVVMFAVGLAGRVAVLATAARH